MNGQAGLKTAGAFCALVTLGGCLDAGGAVSRSPMAMLGLGSDAPATDAALDPALATGAQSDIINGLLNRRSVIGSGGYAQVSDGVLAANSRAAEADLRAAKLRAEARATNWLPTIGPNVSLTSLGDVVSSLVVDAVLFDNGRKRAERDYAAADVEVAAVVLAQDTNDRVLQGLELYVTAQKANARADVNAAAMERMEHFAYVMSERVKGGVSSRVDFNIVQQKLNAMESQMASDREAAAGALAELQAMSATPVSDMSGTSDLSTDLTATPLSVMKARAEAARSMAEAKAAQAGLFPSLTASASRANGETNTGLNLGGANLGFGTGASLKALEQQQAAASARVGQVQEDANRSLRSLEADLASQQRQAAQAQVLASQAAENYAIYAQQQREGTRSVSDVVGLFETKVRTERTASDLRFDVALTALRIAALKGVLVDGDKI